MLLSQVVMASNTIIKNGRNNNNKTSKGVALRIYKKHIERITIIGDRSEKDEAIEYCFEHGYDIKGLARKFIKKYTLDKKKFRLIAEREIK